MNYRQEYEKWLASPALSEDERNELKAIANDENEIENRFYGPLEFGTAGMRGIIGYGTNRMNVYTVRRATKGLADFIKSKAIGIVTIILSPSLNSIFHQTEITADCAVRICEPLCVILFVFACSKLKRTRIYKRCQRDPDR